MTTATTKTAATLLLCGLLGGCVYTRPKDAAKAAVEGLLSADLDRATQAARLVGADALLPMFSDDVQMQRGGGFLRGVRQVRTALLADTSLTGAHITWQPVRGGISADGRQGFTFGHLTMARGSAPPRYLKYMSYWTHTGREWKVAVYKLLRSGSSAPTAERMAPSLPARWAATLEDSMTAATRLREAEQGFSDLASRVGLREAFRRTVAPDGVHAAPGTSSFIAGPDTVSKFVSQGEPDGPAQLFWSADRVIVAATGDLGVSIGTIVVPSTTPGGERRTFPFFTIWRRRSLAEGWHYVAE